jgi:hypothetical protein
MCGREDDVSFNVNHIVFGILASSEAVLTDSIDLDASNT